MEGMHSRGATDLTTARKKKDKKGPQTQYLLHGDTLKDLASFHQS
jgi:hypothetical protein